MLVDAWAWAGTMPDARDWVAADADPGARWRLLTGVFDRPDDDPAVDAARREMLAHPDTADLLGRLEPWDSGARLGGHHDPRFAPNLLGLLADRGLRGGDDPRVESALDSMLEHVGADGRFLALAARRGEAPVWGTLPCDTHAVADVLLRYGRGDDPRLAAGLDRMAADLTETAQGRAWPCIPDPATGFRGPGRRRDMCPQVTLEALRAFSRVPADRRPPRLLDVARVALGAWVRRGTEQPYMFGHGRSFKAGKWPATWYSALEVVDVLGRFPGLWRGPDADPADRRALAEVAACLVAYSTDDAGRVVPRSAFRGWEAHSFGRKTGPSAFATAVTLTALHRIDDLAADVAGVDVAALPSSKGGAGVARPPQPVNPR